MTGLRPPEQLPGMTQAVETIYSAISEKQNILIYGDYELSVELEDGKDYSFTLDRATPIMLEVLSGQE